MRLHHCLLTALFLVACSKHDTTPATPPTPPLIHKYVAAIPPFISTPLAANQLQLTFPWDFHVAQVYLQKDTTVLGVFQAVPQPYFSSSVSIIYPFEPGQQYSFIVESAPAEGIVTRYTLRNYTHTYIASFTFQQLLSLTQNLGPNEFDISPSRKTLFITDDEHNSLITKRLSLTDGSVDSASGVPYGFLRAISDSELLVQGYSYNGRSPGGDTAILNRYNLTTKKTSFVAFTSANYSRMSRIIDNHLLIDGPVFPGYPQLISLVDSSTITYPGANFKLIGSDNFDHLYYANQVVDPATGTLHSLIPPPTVRASWSPTVPPDTSSPPGTRPLSPLLPLPSAITKVTSASITMAT